MSRLGVVRHACLQTYDTGEAMAVTGFELTRLPREARTVRVAALPFVVLFLCLFQSTGSAGTVPARPLACVSDAVSDMRPWSPTVEPAEDSERRASTDLPASGRAGESLPVHLAAAYHRAHRIAIGHGLG